MIIVYVTLLLVLSIVEANQVYNITIQLYNEQVASILSASIVIIYVVVSIHISNTMRILYSTIMLLILLSSYYNIIENKIRDLQEYKNNRIELVEKKIDELRKKYFFTKKQSCNENSNHYASCLYVSSLELKSMNVNREIIDSEIRRLQDVKQDIIDEEIDYSQVYKLAIISTLVSLFMSISIFIISMRISERMNKNQVDRIHELLRKGFTINQVAIRTKLSRATIYRRIKKWK